MHRTDHPVRMQDTHVMQAQISVCVEWLSDDCHLPDTPQSLFPFTSRYNWFDFVSFEGKIKWHGSVSWVIELFYSSCFGHVETLIMKTFDSNNSLSFSCCLLTWTLTANEKERLRGTLNALLQTFGRSSSENIKTDRWNHSKDFSLLKLNET